MPELKLLDGPKAVLPKLTVAAACKGGARVAYGGRNGDAEASGPLVALPSGHLVVAGDDCAGAGLAVEWFAPGEAQGHLVTGGDGCSLVAVAGSRLEALVMRAKCKDEESLFAFDGRKLTPIAYPDTYDFQLTRAALKGHTELSGANLVVTREGGRKYFGAFVTTLELGKKLADVVRRGVKDARAEVLCAKPEILREIDLDWKTGEVRK